MNPRLRTAIATGLVGLAGCTSSVFNEPVTISTRSDATPTLQKLRPVGVERCDTIVLLLFPFFHDPADAFDDLMEQAREAGGNALVDVQVRSDGAGGFIPIFARGCARYTGTAAIAR